jgi:hypothetical protein
MDRISAAIVALTLTVFVSAAFAHDEGRWDHSDRGHHFHGAPAPIAGAGLPFLAVGYGVYWLVKRRRRKSE